MNRTFVATAAVAALSVPLLAAALSCGGGPLSAANNRDLFGYWAGVADTVQVNISIDHDSVIVTGALWLVTASHDTILGSVSGSDTPPRPVSLDLSGYGEFVSSVGAYVSDSMPGLIRDARPPFGRDSLAITLRRP